MTLYSPYQKYQKNQRESEVNAASPVRLVGMLLEGALLFNKKSLASLEAGQRVAALEAAERASKIVAYLYECLDFDKGGAVAEKLGSLYGFLLNQYVEFMRKTDPAVMNSASTVLTTLIDGWKKVEVHPDVGLPQKPLL